MTSIQHLHRIKQAAKTYYDTANQGYRARCYKCGYMWVYRPKDRNRIPPLITCPHCMSKIGFLRAIGVYDVRRGRKPQLTIDDLPLRARETFLTECKKRRVSPSTELRRLLENEKDCETFIKWCIDMCITVSEREKFIEKAKRAFPYLKLWSKKRYQI